MAGEIRIGDRIYLQPDRITAVLDAGGDVVVRAGWRNARRLDQQDEPLNLLAILSRAGERLDRAVKIGRKSGPPLALRLIAVRKPDAVAETARRHVRQQGRKSVYTPSRETLQAASCLIIVTSLPVDTVTTDDVLALYRLRWRIELGFKRLKSLVGLKSPPGIDDRSARPWVLAHLLVDALEDFPPLGRGVPPAALFHRDRQLFRRPASNRPNRVGWMRGIHKNHRFIGG